MKSFPILIGVSVLALSVAACSPSTPASDASASVSETAAATEAAVDDTVSTAAESSAASSVTTVIAEATDTYDPAVFADMGRKPGYWELRRTDPKSHKVLIDKICVDKPTGERLAQDGGRVAPPPSHVEAKTNANWLGACPSDVRAGEVVRHDGKTLDAWNGHHPSQDRGDRDQGGKPGPNDLSDNNQPDQGKPDKGPSGDHGQNPPSSASSSSAPQHNPHMTPDEANKAVGHNGDDRTPPDQKKD